ncbi:MAG: ATP-binding protein [Cyanobacteria bacterium J06649_4]
MNSTRNSINTGIHSPTLNGRTTDTHSHRQIVLAARLGDNANVLREVLESEGQVEVQAPTVETVERAIAREAALIVLTEEVLTNQAKATKLGHCLSQQPAWSDIPVIILLKECQRFGDYLSLLGETTHHRSVLLLELPLKRMIFATVVRASLQNRKRQYALRDSLFQLQESNQALENFSYTAAHELRNPLGRVKTGFDLLARTKLEPQQQKLVDMGQRTANGMNNLLGALLNYSKVQTTTDEFTDVDMESVVQEAVDVVQDTIETAQASVTWETLPLVRGNRQLLVQLMSNLIKNAIVHNDAGVPKVIISAQRSDNNEDSEKAQQEWVIAPPTTTLPRWRFEITDNGPGISADRQDQIFVMFNRAGNNRATGNGIGLALCRRVAQQHQSTIGVQSVIGEGSTFYFDLSST